MKKNSPTIEHTDFLDGEGTVFWSCPGAGNVQTDDEYGEIIKRTRWSDGVITNESGYIYGTTGIPIRKDLELDELSVLRVSDDNY